MKKEGNASSNNRTKMHQTVKPPKRQTVLNSRFRGYSKIYVFGGIIAREHTNLYMDNRICEYDVAANSWRIVEPRIPERYIGQSLCEAASTHISDGEVVVIGSAFEVHEHVSFYVSVTKNSVPPKDMCGASSVTASVRKAACLVRLKDRRVMRIGGLREDGTSDNTVAFHNPSTGSWALQAAGIALPCSSYCMVLMDGSVLVIGGEFAQTKTITNECLLYLPSTRVFVYTTSMHTPRAFHAACIMADGRVFVCGGISSYGAPISDARKCELYDPFSRTWTQLAEMLLPHTMHACRFIGNGRVFIFGGARRDLNPTHIGPECEIYDILNNRFTLAAPMPENRAKFHTITTLKRDY